MMAQTYHLCQVVGQAFQAIPSYKKCKLLKTNKIIQHLFQTFVGNSPKFLSFLHLFSPSSAQFVNHIDSSAEIVGFFLA